jgi:acetyl esterase/lipase
MFFANSVHAIALYDRLRFTGQNSARVAARDSNHEARSLARSKEPNYEEMIMQQAQEPRRGIAIKEIPAPDLPGAIPLDGAGEPNGEPEQWMTMGRDRGVRNVVSAALIPVLPDPAKAAPTAVIVAPGGGFRMLAIDNEGFKAAEWLAERGISAFVLKYRLHETPRDTDAFMAMMMATPPGIPPAAVEDARTALGLVRSRAADWKVDPARVGLMGFSAGAMLGLELALGEDNSARPDFFGLIYGPLSARPVPADAPPAFAILAADDPFFASAGFDLITRYREAGRPVEFHLYEQGGHAFGMRKQGSTSDLWIDQFYAWVKSRGLLD